MIFFLVVSFWAGYARCVFILRQLDLLTFVGFTNGAGRHIETVSPAESVRMLKVCLARLLFRHSTAQQRTTANILGQFVPAVYVGYLATHAFLKLSILFQYLRISVMAFEKRLCYFFVAILGCGFLACFILALTTCIPLYALWTRNVPGAVCLNTTITFSASQIWIISMDFIILIGPLFILRHLTIPWPQRVLLGFILALGAM